MRLIFIISFLTSSTVAFSQIRDESSSLIDSLETLQDKDQLNLLKVISYRLTQENPDSSIYYSTLGLSLARKQNAKDYIGPFQQRLGIAYRIKGEYVTAIEYYKKAEKIFTELDDETGLAVTHNSLGILFLLTKNYQHAISYFERVLEFDERTSYHYGIVSDYNNLAGAYLELNQLEKVAECYKKAFEIIRQENIRSLEPTLWNNIGDHQLLINDPDSALSCYQNAIKLSPDPKTYMHSAIGIGNILMKNSADSSKYFLKMGYDLASKLDDQYVLADAALLLSQFHTNQEEFEVALKYANEYQKFREHLLQTEQVEKINELEIKYESEKKELLIRSQEKRITYSYLIGASIIIILFLIINRLRVQRKVDRLNREKVQAEIDYKNRLLASRTVDINNFENLLNDLKSRIDQSAQDSPSSLALKLKKAIKSKLKDVNDWNEVKMHFEEVHPRFFEKISKIQPPLTANEQKHCAYIKMKISNKDIARMLNVNLSSIHVVHHRMKKKLDLSENESLSEYIDQI